MATAVPEAPIAKRTLNDTGTRWQHWSELVEIFEAGLEAVNNSLARYRNQQDADRKRSLEGALFLIRNQITKMADYDQKIMQLRGEMSKIPPTGWRDKKPLSRLMAEKLGLADGKNATPTEPEEGQEPPQESNV